MFRRISKWITCCISCFWLAVTSVSTTLEVMPIVLQLFLKLFRLSYHFSCKECKVTSMYIEYNSIQFLFFHNLLTIYLFITHTCIHKKTIYIINFCSFIVLGLFTKILFIFLSLRNIIYNKIKLLSYIYKC